MKFHKFHLKIEDEYCTQMHDFESQALQKFDDTRFLHLKVYMYNKYLVHGVYTGGSIRWNKN